LLDSHLLSTRSPDFLLRAVCVLIAAGGLLAPSYVSAQTTNYNVDTPNTNVAYFHYAQPGQATTQVSVWGTVPAPGIYEVREDVELDKLLTMAGGMPIEARKEDETAEITVRLFRQQTDEQRKKVYEAPVDSLLHNTGAYPELQDEDVLVVDTRIESGLDWFDILGIVGSLSSVALTIDRILQR
jgi:hypothetical protein